LKIQEAIIKKNSLKLKIKNTIDGFQFYWDKDQEDVLQKDLKELESKVFGMTSQYADLQNKIAMKNSTVKVQFNGKDIEVIQLILHMQILNQKVGILKSIKSQLQPTNDRYPYNRYQEGETEFIKEKRKVINIIDSQIDSIREEFRNAQAVLEKSNWSEDI